jgi:hypothetical protein
LSNAPVHIEWHFWGWPLSLSIYKSCKTTKRRIWAWTVASCRSNIELCA